ncbi:serine hydrolase [Candidatus Gottesmanbacteria bacterium]|nr:serine hydrolase [Candidatus Gottesmanbacteria bacterium]
MKIFFLFAVVGGILFFLLGAVIFRDSTTKAQILTPLAQSIFRIPEAPASQKTLFQIIEEVLGESKETYGVVIKNLKTGESYSLNEQKKFESASLYKLWVMAVVFEQIQTGKLKEEEVLRRDVQSLNEVFHIASESAELTEGIVAFSVKDAVEKMITISHNYAALLLSEKVRIANVKTFLKANGFTSSSFGEPPVTTPQDIASFFEKLYKDQLINSHYSERMMELLKNQKLDNKLPKYLPENIVVAHKTGELGSFTHDAGIVFGTKSDYILVILSESNSPQGAEERIALLSKAVYEYFEGIPK